MTSGIDAFDLAMLVLFTVAMTLMAVALAGAAARERRVKRDRSSEVHWTIA